MTENEDVIKKLTKNMVLNTEYAFSSVSVAIKFPTLSEKLIRI